MHKVTLAPVGDNFSLRFNAPDTKSFSPLSAVQMARICLRECGMDDGILWSLYVVLSDNPDDSSTAAPQDLTDLLFHIELYENV